MSKNLPDEAKVAKINEIIEEVWNILFFGFLMYFF